MSLRVTSSIMFELLQTKFKIFLKKINMVKVSRGPLKLYNNDEYRFCNLAKKKNIKANRSMEHGAY